MNYDPVNLTRSDVEIGDLIVQVCMYVCMYMYVRMYVYTL